MDIGCIDPTDLAMDIFWRADKVAITDDIGTTKETVRQRSQQAWGLHCAGKGAK